MRHRHGCVWKIRRPPSRPEEYKDLPILSAKGQKVGVRCFACSLTRFVSFKALYLFLTGWKKWCSTFWRFAKKLTWWLLDCRTEAKHREEQIGASAAQSILKNKLFVRWNNKPELRCTGWHTNKNQILHVGRHSARKIRHDPDWTSIL